MRLGEHNAKTDIDCLDGVCAPPVQDIEVEEITCHSNYEKTMFHNDICLLRLAAPIQFNSKYITEKKDTLSYSMSGDNTEFSWSNIQTRGQLSENKSLQSIGNEGNETTFVKSDFTSFHHIFL